MSLIQYLCRGRVTSVLPFLVLIFSSIFRILSSPIEGNVLADCLDMLVYFVYPFIIWIYIQRVNRYFASDYVIIRSNSRKHPSLEQFKYASITSFVISISIVIMNFVLYISICFQLEAILFFIRSIAINLLLTALFQGISVYTKNAKKAFVFSYMIIILIPMSNFIFYLRLRMDMIFVELGISVVSLCIYVTIYLYILYHSKKEVDCYEISY